MRKMLLVIAMLACIGYAYPQKRKVDSLASKLAGEKADSNRVKLMWLMADASNMYDPDTALQLAQKALYLAQKIKYTEGESRSLGVLAVAFRQIGNYQKALEFLLQKLKIEEDRNSPRNLASVLINIGILYINLEQYNEALVYYKRADSVVTRFNVKDLQYYIANNLGDVYERLNLNDSAFNYFTRAVAMATALNDDDLKGTSIVGLGHIYLKQKKFDLASQSYKEALAYLEASNDEDLICEASLGLAKLYKALNMNDSAAYYARYSFNIAKKDGFESRQLDAAQFLTDHFKQANNTDSAFAYFLTAETLKDSIHSKEKIRALQIISSNEHLRQNEIAENKRKAEEERHQQLQMLMIGLSIPVLFLLTLILNRIRIHQRVIKFLGIISLLMLFEYLLLLLHPFVLEFTHHTPIYEILIFVALASILIPAHHRIEHWLIKKLTTRKQHLPAAQEQAADEQATLIEPAIDEEPVPTVQPAMEQEPQASAGKVTDTQEHAEAS